MNYFAQFFQTGTGEKESVSGARSGARGGISRAASDQFCFRVDQVHYIYILIWTSSIGESLCLGKKEDNCWDTHIVGIFDIDIIVGHVPIVIGYSLDLEEVSAVELLDQKTWGRT